MMRGPDDWAIQDLMKLPSAVDMATGDLYAIHPDGRREVYGSLRGCRLCTRCSTHWSDPGPCAHCGAPTAIAGEPAPQAHPLTPDEEATAAFMEESAEDWEAEFRELFTRRPHAP
jgi:hypothetical protein